MIRTAPARSLALRTVPALAAAAVLLTACGPAASSASAAGSSAPSSAARSRPAGFGGFGGVAGPIASVGTGSFTVTENSGTATVDYTGTTVFELMATGTLTDVRAGSCVVVGEAAGSDASTGSVDASSVRVSQPVKGSCTGGAAVGRGGFTGGSGRGQRPSGAPGRFAGGGGGILVGTVASATGSGFVVTVTSSGGSATAAAGTTTAVTVSGATTYMVTTTGAARDLAVGQCARVSTGARRAAGSGSAAPGSAARPTAAPTGPVTAAAVTLSAPVHGSCSGPRSGADRASGSTGAGA